MNARHTFETQRRDLAEVRRRQRLCLNQCGEICRSQPGQCNHMKYRKALPVYKVYFKRPLVMHYYQLELAGKQTLVPAKHNVITLPDTSNRAPSPPPVRSYPNISWLRLDNITAETRHCVLVGHELTLCLYHALLKY